MQFEICMRSACLTNDRNILRARAHVKSLFLLKSLRLSAGDDNQPTREIKYKSF